MAFVQTATASSASASSLTATFGAGVGSGNTVCGFITGGSSPTLSSVKVGGVTANIKDHVTNIGDGQDGWAFILGNITGAPTQVVATFTGANITNAGMICAEKSGCLAASDPTDVHTVNAAQAAGTGTDAVTSTAVTTTVANDNIIGMSVNTSNGDNFSSGTSFTSPPTILNDGIEDPMFAEDGVKASPGSIAATFTSPSAITCTTWIIAIKPAAGGGGGGATPFGILGLADCEW